VTFLYHLSSIRNIYITTSVQRIPLHYILIRTASSVLTCHCIGCQSPKESSLKSQLCHIRYALLLVQRICTRCCKTTSVDPWGHCGQHLGRFYTYHELELLTAVAPLVSLHQLYGSLPADITNAASLTAFRNRLKTFLFHHTPSGCSAD